MTRSVARRLRLPLRAALLASSALAAAPLCAQTADAPEEQDVIPLEGIVVTSPSYETEDTGSYATGLISVGEKEALAPREIPQSTTVVTRQRIEDGDYTSLDTALRQTPGILVLDNDNGRSSIFSRGFEFDYLYFNGLPAPLSSIYGTQPDLSIVDHIEILKGPSGLFAGRGEPAGSVNMRLKQASADFGGYVSATGNTFGRGRGEADITGALNDSGSLRARGVFAYENGDGFVDKQENGVLQGYGTVAYDFSPATTLTLSLSHMERDIAPFNGLPTDADGNLLDLDPDTTTAADWNDFDNTVTDYMAEFEHRFDGGGFVKASGRFSDRDVDFLYAYAGSAADADGNVNGLSWLARDYQEQSLALDVYTSLPYTLAGLRGNVIVGADYQNVDSTLKQARGSIAGTYTLTDWDVSGVPAPDVTWSSDDDSSSNQYGLYTQLRLSPFRDVTLIGGGRLTWYDAHVTDNATGTRSDEQDINGHFTPYLGATYDVNDWATLYTSYTEIFQPQTERDRNGAMLDPREGWQVEVGAKFEFSNGLNASLAFFNLEDTNRAVADPVTGDYVAQEKVRSRGIELEASGEILPGWQLAGGYTYTDTEYLNGASDGEDFSTYTPEHMLRVWTKYSFDTGVLKDVSVGGGFTAMSSFSSRGIEAPGYGVVDLMASYDITETVALQLNVNNVFDKQYYSRVGSTSVFNFYGAPRNASLTLTTRF
ncbi:TonB-dependent siderophore receptor (plasmid) [Paroceanicella profunda]|uniref:TonB-dependent siderophore receptor n=1 Tax=Paroceanicella profunda TaxID=2579971 RepID=A0A5B8FJP8_9RHOB|nr:TonB-dependent siderophore receptor [Paroceanicella profunda]QDL94578.1 TonB-dependent siderophore receptor [Paroceanicella profunda]